MMDIKKFKDMDLYKLFDIQNDDTEENIRKAYRKKALKVHPDKNPAPEAVEIFHQLQDALKILTDSTARAAYDRMRLALKQREVRNSQLDAKRIKLKKDLEAREEAASKHKVDNRTPEEIFKAELERLMKEGDKIIEDENEILRKEMSEVRLGNPVVEKPNSTTFYRLKIKWKASKDDSTNGGYDSTNLTRFLNKYGEVNGLIISKKKNGSAVVEFKDQSAAEMAHQYEKGILSNPLTFEWIGDAPKSNKPGPLARETDFESLVMRQMRLAEERKRIIEQMRREEELEEQGE